ncbi:DUF2786 domain-containing protein [Microbulbifer sp. OS29]|uniref:DUF2786 domain-containing protein n=1 Tax=Microbulbifer okhotskensis TaxID=2926617 RepID=A0A9X2EN55_9GAMM|nr:DUF2786 domain-containing protein [Microbulbifer okhotskensis]MCO1335332.1 DUF2786 domain-containing protein [Microbulbifer okhotskensis]
MEEAILRKIKRCLALAKSSNPNEAATALRQAQTLMQKHGISKADVGASDVGSHISSAVGGGRTPPAYMAVLMNMVAGAFGAKCVYQTQFDNGKWRGVVEFFGLDGAPEIAAYAFEVLGRQLKSDRNAYVSGLNKRLKRTTKIRRGDLYAQGWVQAVSQKVVTHKCSPAERQAMASYEEKRWPNLETAEGRDTTTKARCHDMQAKLQGLIDGEKVDFHRGVRSTKRAALH